MKHDLPITLALLSLFFVSQIIGLAILAQDIDIVTTPTGEINVTHGETTLGPRPETKGIDSFLMVIIAVLIGTGLLLFIIRLGKVEWWKTFFFLAVFMTISVALGVFINYILAYLIAFVLAVLKIYKANIYIHNLTEVLMYSGIALLFVPLFTVEWIIVLLIVISIYDFVAVFKSKHMITMAKFQTESRVFSGFDIPYIRKKDRGVKQARQKNVKAAKEVKAAAGREQVTEAILGGGDIAFPLIFSGVVFESLISIGKLPLIDAFLRTLIIPVIATLTLFYLFYIAKEGRFYPAMPFLTAGCIIGFGIIWIL